MSSITSLTLSDGVELRVEEKKYDDFFQIEISHRSDKELILHWGLTEKINGSWFIPHADFWPDKSSAFEKEALRTPFSTNKKEKKILFKWKNSYQYKFIYFSVYYPNESRWENNNGKNFLINLPVQKIDINDPFGFLKHLKEESVLYSKNFFLPEGIVSVVMEKADVECSIYFISDMKGDLILHWGVTKSRLGEWILPPPDIHPQGSIIHGNNALQTHFLKQSEKLNRVIIKIKEDHSFSGISFILKKEKENLWIKNSGQNFYIPLKSQAENLHTSSSADINSLMLKIVECETERSSWTLMHRFNLCHDLIEEAEYDHEKMAVLFIWLRFSAIRQLDWQRNYNTKPRELSHAQERLTKRLAEVYISRAESRDIIRLIMKTLGPGGEGQRIRDEILNIMHRHHIKEVSGHFMEEWHQKLHNNTTPDDIVICEAYINFLKSDGDLNSFYETLKHGGVTKERLKNFERPIVTDPDFIPHLKDGLIHDFTNYLKLFKSVHSGTDLESAIHEAKRYLNDEINALLRSAWQNRLETGMPLIDRIRLITKARKEINAILNSDNDAVKVRYLIYLDSALEELVRLIIEGNFNKNLSNSELLFLTGEVINNLLFVTSSKELRVVSDEWRKMAEVVTFDREWSLQFKSVKDRISRITSYSVDNYYNLFQEKAQYLGEKFNAEKWTITLFSEEIIRGRLDFVLSVLFHKLDPILRKAADLGDWEIVSPGKSRGEVKIVKSLKEIQSTSFKNQVVVIADEVGGDEDIPEGVTAVITPNAIDIVSHVAVRVRNTGVLFATCHAERTLALLKSKAGQKIELSVTSSGDVVFNELTVSESKNEKIKKVSTSKRVRIQKPDFSAYAFSLDKLEKNMAGSKSYNLKVLREKLPAWIKVPSSVIVPFGIFETIEKLPVNRDLVSNYRNLISHTSTEPEKKLLDIKKLITELSLPEEFIVTLTDTFKEAKISSLDKTADILRCIKEVWASVWNDRAFYSRNRFGIDHESISMAVLIQEIIEADYSFVMHTVNPSSKNSNELYAETVIGMGETLVANYPGRALSFKASKISPYNSLILTYPSKSVALFGKGLIFRSDSSGEDLADYAGAGLYDSVTLNKQTEELLDYQENSITTDRKFREEFASKITEIGVIVENIYKTPQDIEGVYSKGNYYVVQTRPQVGI